jgi:hypothetical protein
MCWLAQWFTTVILATQQAEIRRITVQGQPRQKVDEISFQSIKSIYAGSIHGGL